MISVPYCPEAIEWAEDSFCNVPSRRGGWSSSRWKISVLYCPDAIGRVAGLFHFQAGRFRGRVVTGLAVGPGGSDGKRGRGRRKENKKILIHCIYVLL